MRSDIAIKDEEILLLNLCRLDFKEDHLEAIKAHLSRVSDWKYFSTIANEHGVAALIWHNLEKLGLLSGIPEEVVTFLRYANLRSLGRNTFNSESMREALHALNSENIKTVILKGLALEVSVYGNTGLRQMSDIDILIRRDECLRARKVLLDIGYESLPVKSIFHEFIITYSGKHLPSLIKKGTSIEIHQELFGGKINSLTQALFDTSYPAEINGEKAWFPSPMIFFLYLVRHLSQHELNNESQLRLYADLVILIEKHTEEIINREILKYASEADMSEVLASHLEQLREYWGIIFPDWMNKFIDELHNVDFNKQFVFFLGSPKGNPPIDKAAGYRHIVSEIPGFHRKAIYVLGDIFPSIRFMKKRYGCRSSWSALLHYPHRIGKIMWLIK
jgi:hypothetical protein